MLADPVAIIAKQYPTVVIPLIQQADESIRVIAFDWRFYPTQPGHPVTLFNMALARAVQRGVKIRALVNSQDIAHALGRLGVEARMLHSTKLLHSKLLIFDDSKVVIGSHNLTQHAFSMNEEASVLVEMPGDDNSFTKYFDNLWGL